MKTYLIFLALVISITQLIAQPVPQDTSDIAWQVKMGRFIDKIIFSNDSRQLILSTYELINNETVRFVEIRDVTNGGLIHELPGESEVSLSRDGSILITHSSDSLLIRQYPSLILIKKIISDGLDGKFDIAPDNMTFTSAADVEGIRIFNINSGNIIKTINDFPFKWDQHNGGTRRAYYVRYNFDGTKILFSGDWAFIYDLTLDTIIHTFSQSLSPTYSPDYSKIAIKQSNPAEVYIYNSEFYQQDYKISLGGNNNFDFVFSPDGKYVITANDNGYLNIWDIDSQKIVYNFYFDMFPKPALGHPAYSNDGKYIAFESGRLFLIAPKITSVEDTLHPLQKILYPNPTTGIVKLEFNLQSNEIVRINISDNTGKNISNTNLGLLNSGKNIYEYNITSLTAGVYFITIQSQSYSETYKLIKE